MKRLIGLSLAILMILPLLSGCHGSSGRSAFQVPGEFDETKTYEITFWSKNDNNQTQRDIYKKAIALSEHKGHPEALYRLRQHIQ